MRKLVISFVLIVAFVLSQAMVFGATDPSITILNPENDSTVASSNLLISIKLTEPRSIRVTVTEEKKTGAGAGAKTTSTPLAEPETYTSKNNLSFYTKKFEKVSPGNYKVQVDVLNAKGTVTATLVSSVTMKEKEAEEVKPFQSTQSGTTQFLQNLLKSIFGE